MSARYRVHKFNFDMTRDRARLEHFLNSLEGEVVTIIPYTGQTGIDFVYIVEKLG